MKNVYCIFYIERKFYKNINKELKAKGYLTVAGRVSRAYYLERIYGASKGDE